ncbi:MAG: glycosyltransferase family 39 protein [Candidatus Omnitrophica bacterium]|nr:glycosyltransferase family 39 protein [Candidatus Omnitrophota bacterium]
MRKIVILLLLLVVFFFLGNHIVSLTNPDEVFYVQTAKEMAERGTWSTPYLFGQPQFEKPILTYDFLRLSALVGGFTPFSMRFFPALFGALGVLAIYVLGILGFPDRRKAWLGALVLMSSFFYLGMGRVVFSDMIFSAFITLALVVFYWGYVTQQHRRWAFVLFYVFCALAVLTKGPIGFLIPFTAIILFLAIKGQLDVIMRPSFWVGLFLFLLLAIPWYGAMVKMYGNGFIDEFFVNDHIRRIFEAEHASNDKWYFYPLAIILGMFPWVIFVVTAFVMYGRNIILRNISSTRLFLLIWVATVLLTFQFAHSKLVSYILPLFPALALMVGDFLDEELTRNARTIRLHLLFSCLASMFIPVVLLVFAFKYPMYLPSKAESIGVLLFSFVMMGGMVVLVFRRKFLGCVYVLAFQTLFVFMCIFVSAHRLEDYVASKNSASFLKTQPEVQGKILCSKMFLRGIRFYTNKDVALISIGRAPLFSPHPVPVLDDDAKVIDFLKTHPVTYCVLDSAAREDIQRISGLMGRREELLRVMGNQYIVRITLVNS